MDTNDQDRRPEVPEPEAAVTEVTESDELSDEALDSVSGGIRFNITA